MARILITVGWVLALVGALLFVGSFWLPSQLLEPLKNAVPAGVLVALAGHLLAQGRAASDASEKLSLFYLESTVKAYEAARHLLEDGNNDRATWIAAGRALMQANELKRNISFAAHKHVLELDELKYRGFFHDLLASRPPAFFYGIPDLHLPLDEAAILSSADAEVNGRRIISPVRELSTKSLFAVWQAAQWPKGYEDPLNRDFSEAESVKLSLLFPTLNQFLEHKQRYHAVSGRLIEKKRPGAS